MLVCRLNDAIILRREMVKQRWNPMGIVSPGSPGLYEEQYDKSLGKYAEYSISQHRLVQPEDDDDEDGRVGLQEAYPKDELHFHGINAGYTFDAIMIAADAFKRAHSTDPKTLADAIRQTNIAVQRMSLGGADQVQPEGPGRGQLVGCDPEPEGQAQRRAAHGVRRGQGDLPGPEYKRPEAPRRGGEGRHPRPF